MYAYEKNYPFPAPGIFCFYSFAQLTALVGGTLIDGFGSKPIHNSVIIIEGEKIKAIGRVGGNYHSLRCKDHFDRRHVGYARFMGHARTHDD